MKPNSKRFRKAQRSWRQRLVNRVLKSARSNAKHIGLKLDSPGGFARAFSELQAHQQRIYARIIKYGVEHGHIPKCEPDDFVFTMETHSAALREFAPRCSVRRSYA